MFAQGRIKIMDWETLAGQSYEIMSSLEPVTLVAEHSVCLGLESEGTSRSVFYTYLSVARFGLAVECFFSSR